MLNYFPQYFVNRAIALYFIALVAVFALFTNNFMQLQFLPFGIAAVVGFFYFSNILTKKWNSCPEKKFKKKLFITALVIRVVWVIFSYFYYFTQTGTPFDMFGDAWGYHQCGTEIAAGLREGNWGIFAVYLEIFGFSDVGFMSYMGVIYWLTGDSIIIARLLNALYSAFMCVLIYNLTRRNFGESTGRIAGILSMLMPHFVYYCGLHLKEMVMVFLSVAFVERADYLLRSKKYNFLNIALPILLAGVLFTFRTILGATALLAFFSAVVFSSAKVINWKKRILVGVWIIAVVGYFAGGRIAAEVEELWELGTIESQQENMEWRAQRMGDYSNEFARYAGVAVFASMIFTIPFPTIVNIELQTIQQRRNGDNFVKNIMSFFTIFGIFLLLYRRKWRDHVLILAFLTGYLAILAMSNFAHSERFHMPSLPFALIIASYGISQMDNEKKKYFNWWTMVIFVAIIIWSWFKLAGRGIV